MNDSAKSPHSDRDQAATKRRSRLLGFVGTMLVLAVGLQFVAKPPKPEHTELLVFDLGLTLIGCGLIGASWTRRRWIGAACGLAVGPAIGGASVSGTDGSGHGG